jgi:hypothetical protein
MLFGQLSIKENMEQIVTGHFNDHQAAEATVRALGEAGFPYPNISIVTQNRQSTEQPQGLVTPSDAQPPTPLLGAIGGLLLGAAVLTIPIFGPLFVAGPLSANFFGALDGALVGTSSGGLVGALMGYGLPRDKALQYQTIVRTGVFLVMAHGNETQIELARGVLEDHQASDLEVVPSNGKIVKLARSDARASTKLEDEMYGQGGNNH